MNQFDQVELTKVTASQNQNVHNLKNESTHLSDDVKVPINKDDDLTNDQGFENDNLTNREFKRNFGNCFICLFYKGEPLITIGPNWPFVICMISTFGIVSYIMLRFIVIQKSWLWQTISVLIVTIQIVSYLLCALINPGIVTAKEQPQNDEGLQCDICKNSRLIQGLTHCYDCNVCVQAYDHHCPWTGKCIAKGNLRYFYLFITMIPLYIVYFCFMAVV